MNKKGILLILTGYMLVATSCFKSQNNPAYSSFFAGEISGNKKIEMNKISIDTITLTNVNTSYLGFSAISGDSIYLIDKLFCWVYILDLDGQLITRKLGQGAGPKELDLKFVDSFCFLHDGRKLFVGSSLDLHLYDKNWNRIAKKVIDWRGEYTYTDIYQIDSPDPAEISLYGFEYEKFKIINSFKHPDVVLVPIYSEHKDFNAFVSEDYYKKGRIMASIDIRKAKVVGLNGRRPPVYLENKYLGHHSFYSFTLTSEDEIFITHEIDSLIYMYDYDFNLLRKFGYAGRNMNANYTPLTTNFDINKIRHLYFADKPQKGYYEELFYDEANTLLFRSYKKGNKQKVDGLQIYRENVLIADVDVPKEFVILGYIKPYYFSKAIFDEEREQIVIYRFKI